ncbi:hypothetical protein [Marivita sp. XM-24bin2]|jgi:hypothetical protein|uniref:hypothetical protein n=1 Tax=unclassified Marivita TaxID=2632480 RepID=UPI000D79E58F|nr:hypothetical protein [Marivita sp. XM-24bin2]MCR9110393.1 hypothetical protein [Paracoccaceae bacterium]PWL36070.1 MAG: hypothetical protein DCO97_06435 [Marivita sp. XM-24bin2]
MKQVLVVIVVLFAGVAIWLSVEPASTSAVSGEGTDAALSDGPKDAFDALKTAIVTAAASADAAIDNAAEAMETLLDASGCCGYQPS